MRWAGGTMPTTFAFTGQRADSSTGLDFYGARYYDPAAGCFISADTVLPGGGFETGGMNRYGYVEGNPVSKVDPTGHDQWWHDPTPSLRCINDSSCEPAGYADSGYEPPTSLYVGCGGDQYGASVKCGGAGNAYPCLGKHHCIVLITGVDVSSGIDRGLMSDIQDWQLWIAAISKEFDGDVGFILFEVQKATPGAEVIHETLAALADSGYQGTISLVGESSGAAAIFQYFAYADQNYSGDPEITSFVAMDAPNSKIAGDSQFTNWWADWNPSITADMASDYLRGHPNIRGVYAWNTNDEASQEMDGAWDNYQFTAGSNDLRDPNGQNPHTYLVYNSPPATLLNYLVGG
jgi:RHS repeat-associated protein